MIALGLVAAAAVAGLDLEPGRAPRGGLSARGPRRQPRRRARGRRLPHLGHEDRPRRRRRAGSADRARPRCDRLHRRRARGPPRERAARGRRLHRRTRCAPRRGPRLRLARTSSRTRSPTACTSRTAPPAHRCSRRSASEPPAGALGVDALRLRPDRHRVGRAANPPRRAPHELGRRFPDVSVLTLPVSPRGAHLL